MLRFTFRIAIPNRVSTRLTGNGPISVFMGEQPQGTNARCASGCLSDRGPADIRNCTETMPGPGWAVDGRRGATSNSCADHATFVNQPNRIDEVGAGNVTRDQCSRIMDLLLVPPNTREGLQFPPTVIEGLDYVDERGLSLAVAEMDWSRQPHPKRRTISGPRHREASDVVEVAKSTLATVKTIGAARRGCVADNGEAQNVGKTPVRSSSVLWMAHCRRQLSQSPCRRMYSASRW